MKNSTKLLTLVTLILGNVSLGLETAYLKADIPSRLNCHQNTSWVCNSSKNIRRDLSVFISAYTKPASEKSNATKDVVELIGEAKAGTLLDKGDVIRTVWINGHEWAEVKSSLHFKEVRASMFETVVKVKGKLVLVQIYGLIPTTISKQHDVEFDNTIKSLQIQNPQTIEKFLADTKVAAKDSSIREAKREEASKEVILPSQASLK